MTRFGTTWWAMGWVMVLFASCSPQAQHAASHKREGLRIVVVGIPLYLDILKAYGEQDSVVAVVDSPNTPTEFALLPKVGVPLLPNIESIIAQHPGLVLGATETLRRQLPPSMRVSIGERMVQNISDVVTLMKEVGVLIGKNTEQIDRLVASFQKDVGSSVHMAAGCSTRRVAFLFPSIDQVYYSVENKSMEQEAIRLLGSMNVLAETSPGKPVPIEFLLRTNPDVVLTDHSMVARIYADTRLSTVSAVLHKQVLGVRMADFVSVHFPGLLRFLAKALYQGQPCMIASPT